MSQPKELIELIYSQISTTDHQIDQLVHELYDLTADEMKIVEGAI